MQQTLRMSRWEAARSRSYESHQGETSPLRAKHTCHDSMEYVHRRLRLSLVWSTAGLIDIVAR